MPVQEHDETDYDASVWAWHHSLGKKPTQAAPGNHKHDDRYTPKSSIYAFVNRIRTTDSAGLADSVWTTVLFAVVDQSNASPDVSYTAGSWNLLRAGRWLINTGVFFAANPTGNRGLRLTKNGTVYAVSRAAAFAGAVAGNTLSSVILTTDKTSTVLIEAFQSSGGALAIVGSAATCYSQITYLGP